MSLPIPDEIYQAAFELLMCLPKLRVVNIDDAAPKLGFGQVFLPVAEMLLVKVRKLRSHPRLSVNTVGDAGDRYFVNRNARPHIFPKRASDFTVHITDAIRVSAKAQRQDGHAERIVRMDSSMAESEQLL